MLQSWPMSSNKTIASLLATAVSVAAVFIFAVPAAHADISGDSNANGTAVTSFRSFPSYTTARKDLTVEHTSTDVEDTADWGSTESLDVPQTKSQAEKDRESEEAKAKEEAEARAKEEAAAAEALAAEAQAASRSQQRTAQNGANDETVSGESGESSESASSSAGSTSSSVEVSGNAGAAVAAAYALLGQSMDCTALVSAALAAGGINFHGWPEEYAGLGEHVSEPQPGDILVYRYTGGWNGGAHWDHVAIYVGNGQAIHGGWNGTTVALAGMMNPDVIVRVF